MSPLVPTIRSSTGRWKAASRSLRARLIIASIIVIALAVGAVGLVGAAVTRFELTRNVGNTLQGAAFDQALIVATQLERQVVTLQAFGLSETVQDPVEQAAKSRSGDQATIQRTLQEVDQRWRAAPDSDPLVRDALDSRVASELNEYSATYIDNADMLVTDRHGALIAASRRPPAYYYANEEWWQATWNNGQGAVFIGQPVQNPGAGSFGLIISVPLYGHGSREVVGVLRTTYKLASLGGLVSTIRMGETGRAQVLLPDKQVLAADGQPMPLDDSIAESLTDTDAPYVDISSGGETRLVGQAPITATTPAISALGWRLAVSQNRAEALQPVTTSVQTMLLVTLAVLLLAIIPAAILAQFISAPLQRMTEAARQIASGDLGQRLALAQDDEIGQLAQSFDAMAEALQQRIADEQAAQAERLRLQEDIIRIQEATLDELSTPLIPLSDTVLLLPLLGTIDSRRATSILEALLRGVAARRAQAVILDLTGVVVVDTQVAQTLLGAAAGVRLLGASVALVGIRAEVAQTIIGLGMDFTSLEVYANLQAALDALLLGSVAHTAFDGRR